jgi:2,3-dihydroxybenzoate decarboxylase
MGEATEWFDHAAISESDRVKIGRGNAQKLFRI